MEASEIYPAPPRHEQMVTERLRPRGQESL